MELRHLRYFVAVAREGHITRAARKLNIAQPPLSQQIKQLEAELKAPLFVRQPRGVALTDAGRSFLADAEAILADVERARSKAQRTARGEVGRIAVGFTTSAPFHPLQDEDMVAALPARHPLAKAKGLTLRDLANETLILYRRPDGRGLYDVIIAACAEAGFSPHVGQEAPRIVSTLNLVAAGLGVTLVPASLSRLPLEGVVYRPLKGKPAVKVPLNLACRRNERSAAVLSFIELVRKQAT